MDTCENCGATIGKLETPRVFSGHVVCAECDGKLRKSRAVDTVPIAEVAIDPSDIENEIQSRKPHHGGLDMRLSDYESKVIQRAKIKPAGKPLQAAGATLSILSIVVAMLARRLENDPDYNIDTCRQVFSFGIAFVIIGMLIFAVGRVKGEGKPS